MQEENAAKLPIHMTIDCLYTKHKMITVMTLNRVQWNILVSDVDVCNI